MLQTKAVEPGTLSVLKKIMEMPELQSFNLVGGTALALRYGHRISVDLDLFSTISFDHQKITDALIKVFGSSFQQGLPAKWGIFCYIENIKVDIIHYPHAMIEPYETCENIRLCTDKDLIAMKVQAILDRGKKKDFWDIAELLQHYTLPEVIEFHRAKYPNQMLLIAIPQALIYFDDADESEDPICLKGQTWADVKKIIREKVDEFLM